MIRINEQIRRRLLQSGGASPRRHAELAEAAPTTLGLGHEVRTGTSAHWLIQRSVRELWPRSDEFVQNFLSTHGPGDDKQADDTRLFRERFPATTLFFDLETCGFAGSMIFLIGLLHLEENELRLTQLWARHYSEEQSILASFEQQLRGSSLLVSFNGKSFDWPQVKDRLTLFAGRPYVANEPAHFDLLHASRRRWKRRLPNCKLQTLERFLCGRHRVGDIPGRDIPAAYQRYVQTGDVAEVSSILHHNALDLITLLQLALRIGGGTK